MTPTLASTILPRMTEPIDWAAAVVQIRQRAQLHKADIASGDRSSRLRASMQRDADILAECIEQAGTADGSWAALHDLLESWIKLCTH